MRKRLFGIVLTLCMALTLLPTVALAAEDTLLDGWYNLRCMYNYLNLTSDGKAELRNLSENEAFYVADVSNGDLNLVTLKMKDGRYLGLSGERKDGARVVAVSEPYAWALIWEKKSEIFSLRPPEYLSKSVSASGAKKADGTPIIIWTKEGSDGGSYGAFSAPEHGEFRFIPVTAISDPTGESYRTFKDQSGLYGYKNFTGKVVIPAQFDRAIDFSQGVALVSLPGESKYAYINTAGTAITPYKYEVASSGRSVHDGLIRVGTQTYSAALQKALDGGDKMEYTEYKDGIGTIVMKSGKTFPGSSIINKTGFINTKGVEVIPPQFERANDFCDGRAAVFQLQGVVDSMDYEKVGWIDTTGKLVIPYQSEEHSWYSGVVHNFEDGFVAYFKQNKEGLGFMPAGGILDKNGKVIIPAELGTITDDENYGLRWKDGVIAVTRYCKSNIKGQRDASGKYWWPHLYLYDYTGKLIAKPEGYTDGYPLGGGYTLSMYQVPTTERVQFLDTEEYPCYWSVFDRSGNKVVEKAEENNYYLLSSHCGYENGYVFFGETRVKVADVPVTAAKHPFTDVKAGSYYEDAVIWAKENGVTGGTTATTFSPNATCTRGQVVTFLWRAKGSPEPKSADNPFTDVKSTDYFYKAVLWAVEQGITGGTTATTFSPGNTCTTGQVLTFLWRSNGSPASTGADSPYYAKAVSWAAEKGLLDNMGTFSATKQSPRADIVTYLYRNAK